MSKTIQGLNWSQFFSEHQTKEKSGEISSHIASIVFRRLSVQCHASVWDTMFFPRASVKKALEKWTPNLDL